ncbi:MAG: cupin domain-containing protein [Burkholderiales bacterium]|nr:cupin domain-containing protein [Burkholderiales bacterium]
MLRLLRKLFLIAAALSAAPLAQSEPEGAVNVLPGDLKWAFNAGVPRPIQLATVYGNPGQPGPYVFRARIPAGTPLPPHRHPDERWVTVLAGTYRSGVGEHYDLDRAIEYPTGSFYVTPGNTPHFAYAVDDVIVQEQGNGPTGMDYVHRHDDPRTSK